MEPFLPVIPSFLSPFTPTVRLDYPFRYISSVGSYQVGYTRSHPNTEVKMLRACSVPLCSHRWERQVIYLLFFLIYHYHNCHHYTITTTVPILHILSRYNCTRYMPVLVLLCPYALSFLPVSFCFFFDLCLFSFFYIERFHGVVGYHITFT